MVKPNEIENKHCYLFCDILRYSSYGVQSQPSQSQIPELSILNGTVATNEPPPAPPAGVTVPVVPAAHGTRAMYS